MRVEGERRVRRRRPEDRRLQSQEVSERLSFFSGRRFDRSQALTIFGHPHHHVAQKCGLGRGRGAGPACGGRLHSGQLVLHFWRPADERALIWATADFKRGSVSALRRDPAQLQQRGQIVRLSGENLLHQLLKFGVAVVCALPLSFFRQPVEWRADSEDSDRLLCASRRSPAAELPRWLSRIPSRS